MDREEFRQLLKETDDKLSILGNVEILRQCKMNLGELYDLIKIFLTDRDISKLLEYKHFQKWPSYKRKELILMISDSEILLKMLQDEEKMEGFKSWDLESFIEKLNDSDKEKLLNTPGWFESHGFLPYEVSKIIAEMEDSIKYNIVSNPDLICNMLQLDNIDISDIIVTLKKEEDKDKLLDTYQLEEVLQDKIVATYSDEGKEKFLSDTQLGKYRKILILKSFNIDNLIKYINNPETDLSDLGIYEIIMELDESHQEEFISKLDTVNLTEDEKREIFVTLKPETKEKIDISQLKPSFVNALNMKTTEYGGKIILDLFADVQQYRGLDRLLSVNPTRLYGQEKAKFMQLCAICPEMTVLSSLDSKDDEKVTTEWSSSASEYLDAEKWIEKVMYKLKPEYTDAQKIAIIDNEIGQKISYSPDFETEVFDSNDCRALYKIISSGYGVCNGIARVEQYLIERAGLDIECEIVSSGRHAFIKLNNMEFELSNGERVVGTTILDPTWNLTDHRFNCRPNNFCVSYEEARKNDVDDEGKDHNCHKNDEKLHDATFNLDDASLRKLFKSVGLTDKDGNFPIKYLIDKSSELNQRYKNNPLKNLEEQFLLLKKVCPEFASCQNSTMSILYDLILDNEFLKYDKCEVNRVYNKSDKNKRPITFVYINFEELGEKFYYADKEKGEFIYISKEEFLEQFECYKADLEKSNGIRPWEQQSRDTKKQIDLASSSGTVAVQKEEER